MDTTAGTPVRTPSTSPRTLHPSRATLSTLCGLLAGWLALAPAAAAHSPHDVATLVEVSPDFERDRTVFAAFTLTEHQLLGRSRDAGRSWELYAPPMMLHGLSSLDFSPGFADDRTLFASNASDGVFRSTDGGDTWLPISAGLSDLSVNDLAVSPDFVRDRALLVATDSGCFRSVDGGDTWQRASVGLAHEPIEAVSFATGGVAFACGRVMHRSSNAGLSWAPVKSFPFPAAAIVASPDYASDSTAAVCFGRYGNGLHASLDGGRNWAPVTAGLTDPFVNDVAIADDGTVFAVTKNAGCFRAPDMASPFVSIIAGFEEPSELTPNHNLSVSLSPGFGADGTAFVAAFEGLHRSQNSGALWVQQDVYWQHINRRVILAEDAAGQRQLLMGNYGGGLQVSHPGFPPPATTATGPSLGAGTGTVGFGSGSSVGAGVAVPAPSLALAAPGAMSLLPDATTGLAWSAHADGLGALWTEVLEASPAFAQDDTLLLGHVGLWLSTDRGRSWSELPVPPWDRPIRAAAFSPQWTTDQTLFVAREEGGVFRSNDGGAHWSLVADGLPFGDSMSFIRLAPQWPADSLALISGKSGHVYRSHDGCESWGPSSGLPGGEVRALELSPDFLHDRLALAGTVGDGVYRSDDGGLSWTPCDSGLPSDIPLVVEGLAFSPGFAADGTVFLSLITGGVYRSVDRARSWTRVDVNLPLAAPRVFGISPDFAADRTLVLLTHDWAWSSQDAGVHWERLPGFIRVDDLHPGLAYQGTWKVVASAGVTGLGQRLNGQPGAFTELEFRGRTIDWFSRTGPAEGSVHVLIDGRLAATVNLSKPVLSNQVKAFTRSFPEVGWHTIRVVNAGAQGGNASVRVMSDGFAYSF